MTGNDYRELLYLLLPDGYARDGQRLNAELQAEGTALASVERSAQDVLNGVTPFTAVALLSGWERVLALPVSNGMTIQARRQQIMAKLNETGGLSRRYFIRLAKSLGYDITIDEPEPFRFGRNCCGDRLRCGSWATGERLMSFGQNMLENIFRDLKPAHTQVVFNYAGSKTE